MRTLFLSFVFLTQRVVKSSGGGAFTYHQNGAEWPTEFEACGGLNQSPIDLSLAEDQVDPDSVQDDFVTHYEDLDKRTVKWIEGSATVKVEVQPQKAYPSRQYLKSNKMQKADGSDVRFDANQFHFHSNSEHTIDGQRFDLEMHIVHYPETEKTNAVASALGVIFDTENYDESVTEEQRQLIDKFFTQLSFGAEDPEVSEIAFGQLMSVVDSANRWVYKGSLTTPPCSTIVHWNVVSKVYPISPAHVELFRQKLRGHGTGLDVNGNYRVTQKIDKHDPKLIKKGGVLEEEESSGLMSQRGGAPGIDDILFIAVIFMTFIMLGLSVYLCFKRGLLFKHEEEEEDDEEVEKNQARKKQERSKQYIEKSGVNESALHLNEQPLESWNSGFSPARAIANFKNSESVPSPRPNTSVQPDISVQNMDDQSNFYAAGSIFNITQNKYDVKTTPQIPQEFATDQNEFEGRAQQNIEQKEYFKLAPVEQQDSEALKNIPMWELAKMRNSLQNGNQPDQQQTQIKYEKSESSMNESMSHISDEGARKKA